MPLGGGENRTGPDRGSMFCLDCNYVLDGLRSRVCPECGRAFDPEHPATFRHLPEGLDDPVRLTQLPIGDAFLLQARLEAHSLRAAVHEERGGVIGYAEMPKGSIWVEREDADHAREIMESPHAQEDRDPWTCTGCGERLEGQFEICWNCGAERE